MCYNSVTMSVNQLNIGPIYISFICLGVLREKKQKTSQQHQQKKIIHNHITLLHD